MGVIRNSGLVWFGGCAALLSVCGVAAFCGLIFSGTVGGVAIGAAPNFAFGLVEPLVCPEGSELAYQEFRRSFDAPGEAAPDVACVTQEGETQDVLVRSMGAVFGLMFLVGSAPVFLVLVALLALAFLIARRLSHRVSSKWNRLSGL